MRRAKVKRATNIPDYYPKTEVICQGGKDVGPVTECVRGSDGKLIYPGRTVRRLPYWHESLGVTVSTSYGRVELVYRQEGRSNPETGCTMIVQTANGHTYYADQCVRSTAGEAGDAEHKLLLKQDKDAKGAKQDETDTT